MFVLLDCLCGWLVGWFICFLVFVVLKVSFLQFGRKGLQFFSCCIPNVLCLIWRWNANTFPSRITYIRQVEEPETNDKCNCVLPVTQKNLHMQTFVIYPYEKLPDWSKCALQKCQLPCHLRSQAQPSPAPHTAWGIRSACSSHVHSGLWLVRCNRPAPPSRRLPLVRHSDCKEFQSPMKWLLGLVRRCGHRSPEVAKLLEEDVRSTTCMFFLWFILCIPACAYKIGMHLSWFNVRVVVESPLFLHVYYINYLFI